MKQARLGTLDKLQAAYTNNTLYQWTASIQIRRVICALAHARTQATRSEATTEDKQRWSLALQVIRRQRATAAPRETRPLIVCGYIGRAIETLQLPQLVGDKEVMSYLPITARRVLGAPL